MIKIDRILKPSYLSDKKTVFLQNQHNKGVKGVWNKPSIKKALFDMSFGKCAYCECFVNAKGSYLEVEHFKPKKIYPLSVVDWNNLLPACKSCNGAKNDHDTINEPIINPCIDEPKEHLFIHDCRLGSETIKGKETISVLNLNDYDNLIKHRFQLCNQLRDDLELCCKFSDVDSSIRNKVLGLLKSCQKDKEFSAFLSNAIHKDINYLNIKQKLITKNLWNNELEDLDNQTKKLALPSR